MTAQIPDFVLYRDRGYALAGISGSGLFDSSEDGMVVDDWIDITFDHSHNPMW